MKNVASIRGFLVASGILSVCGGLFGPVAGRVSAAEAPPPVVQLPAMIVSEPANGQPWLYASGPGFEIVSRCSRSTTLGFAQARERQEQKLRVIVPEDFLMKSDVPSVYVLYSQELRKGDDAVFREMIDAENRRITAQRKPATPVSSMPTINPTASLRRFGPGAIDTEEPATPKPNAVQFLPNQRIEDRDITGLFAYLDDDNFDGDSLDLAPEDVFIRLSRRTPTLAPAVCVGVTQVYAALAIGADEVTAPPVVWISKEESEALRHDPEYPRGLLSITDLFTTDGNMGGPDGLRARIWRSEAALFFRWSLEAVQRRRAYWEFARRAAVEPITEQLVRDCFGFGLADLLDALSDYLPMAVGQSVQLPLGKLPKPPPVQIRPATDTDLSRVKGDWERLEIGFVKKQHPEFADHYIAQARKTLYLAYNNGSRDPRLLASLGLFEIAAGNNTAARPLLEAAVAANVVRPNAYFELASLREAAVAGNGRDQGARYSAAEIAGALEPLRLAAKQAPALSEVYFSLGELWHRASELPPAGDLELLASGARLFPRQSQIAVRAAYQLARASQWKESLALIAMAIRNCPDEHRRRDLVQLQSDLEKRAPH